MTVLVGALCTDGVVIGSDSSVTFAGGGIATIEHPATKLHIIEDEILAAFAGDLGLAQRFRACTGAVRRNTCWPEWSDIDVGKAICVEARSDFTSTGLIPGQIDFACLVGFPREDVIGRRRYNLGVIASNLQPLLLDERLWFFSLGSGKMITDPFLGLLSRTLFRGSQPDLRGGVFAVAWAIENAIRLNPGGINGPPQIGTLSNADGRPARIMSPDELSEHAESVANAEEHLAAYRDMLVRSPAGTGSPDPPPA